MPFDENLAQRIRNILEQKTIAFEEKKMMGGLCFMVDDKMICGIHFDKKRNTDLLVARVGKDAHDDALSRKGCFPMDMTGRPMKGFLYVTPDGIDSEYDLKSWLQLTLDYNPLAPKRKKKK